MVRALALLGLLGAAYVVHTQMVSFGVTDGLDLWVARALQRMWQPSLHPLWQGIAILGGLELTALLAAAMAVFLQWRGFRMESWALLTLPLAQVLEFLYKRLLFHPPPVAFAHADGPSLVTILPSETLALVGSYPSGHSMRTVLIYGLGAFIVFRLAPPGRARSLAWPLAAIVIALTALDRVYLGLHWQSDVVGGLILGGAALAVSIAWLDLPRAPA